MSVAKSKTPGLTRRSFLKTTAVVAGAAALTGATEGLIGCSSIGPTQSVTAGEDETYSGVCIGNCNGGCRLNITTREGKVVETAMAEFPDPDYNRICLKGLSHVQRIYGPKRFKYPMRRVGERGSGEWEQISWEEAIDEITTKWKSYIKDFGSTSLAFQIGGVTRTGAYAYQQLAPLTGGTSLVACDDYAGNYVAPMLVGNTPCFAASELKSMTYSNTVIVWGSNPTDSHLVNYRFFLDAKANGAKTYAIDPVFTTAASKVDEYVPIKPGTDATLAMAMANHIINSGLADIDFLRRSTVAPFLVKESDGKYLRFSDIGREPLEGPPDAAGNPTTVDELLIVDEAGNLGSQAEIVDPVIEGSFTFGGIKVTTAYSLLIKSLSEWTPEKAEKMCGVPAGNIETLAEQVVKGSPTCVYLVMGPDHYYNGHLAFTAIATMLMVAGQFGKAGTGWTVGYNEGWNMNWAGLTMPDGKRALLRIPVVSFPDAVKEKKFNGNDVTLKSLFMCGKNILGNACGRASWVEAFDNLDLVVCPNFEMSDTASFADIVLPITHFFEGEDFLAVGQPHSFDVWQDKAIDPLFECKSDFEIGKLLIEGMGFKFDYTLEEFLNLAIDTPLSKAAGISYATLKEKKIIDVVLPSQRDENGLLMLGLNNQWRTATGKCQFYFETVAPRYDAGIDFDREIERLPHYEPPIEVGEDNPLAKDYPLVCIQPHSKWRAHTTFSWVEWLRELDPEPVAYLSPSDAVDRGLLEGDIVKVYNERGFVVLKLHYHKGIQPGVVLIPKGWQYGSYIDGHYQDLTTRAFHPFTTNHIFFDCRVQIEKTS